MYEKGDMGNPYRWEFQEKKSFVMRLGSQSISSFLALSLVAIIAAASVSMVSSEVVAYKSEADVVNRQTFGYRSLSHEGSVLAAVTNNVDPLLLPKATGQGTPATNPQASTQPNSFYLDPTSGAKVWRATGPSYPCANNGGDSFHDYGDITQISLDMGGAKHTLLIHTCGDYKLVDFTRGVGFSNWRNFAQGASPNRDLDFTFSNKLETPHIAYVLSGTKVVRYNTLTNQIENNGFFPFAVGDGDWLQNDKNDVNFVLTAGGSCKSFNTATGQIRTATWPGHDECHLENNGRYVNLNTGDGGDGLWDLETNTTSAFNTPSGNIFHNASPSRYFTSVDVETGGGKTPHYRLDPVTKTGTKITDFCGYMSGFHHSGGWIQRGVPEEQQWVSISTYAGGNGCLKNAIGLMRLDNGDVRFLAHTYQSGNNYFQLPFGSLSAGGELLMFNSNSLGSRGDVYVVELPINGSVSPNPTPPPPTTQTQVVDGYIDSVSSSGVNGWFFSQKNDTSAVVTYVNVSTSATYTQTLTRSISRSDASSYLSSTYGSTLPVTQPLGFVGDPRSVLTVPGTYRIQSVKLNTSNTVIAISSAASATFVISSTQTPPPPPAPTPPPPAPTPPPPPAPSTSTVKLAINSPVANQTISANNVEVRMQIQVASGNTQDYSHVMIKLDNGSEVRVSGGIHLFSNVTSGSHTVSGYVAKADGSKIAGSESSVSFTVQNSNTTTPPPPTPTPPPPAPTPPTSGGSFNSTLPQNVSDRLPYGYLDGINQDGVVGGWAIDGNNANGFVDIHFYVDRGAGSGRTPAFSTKADKQRSDVGPHGFEVAVPAQFKDGRIHRLYAYGINQSDNSQWRQLLGSPVNFRLTASSSSSLPVRDDRDRLPYGYLDAVNATGLVTGWAVDGNDSEQSVDIHFYIDTAAGSGRTPSFTTKANVARADVGPHGFEASIPAAYRDGKTHRIYAYGINKSNSSQWRVLLGSPITFRYTGAQPSGGNSGLPLDLWKTGQDLPESKTFTYNVASMAQNSTKAVLALNVFDPDFSDEGQVCINNDSQCINLFGNMSNGDYQEINRDVNFETPASWWKAGANTLTFKHSQTDGYRIVNLSVTFGSGNVTPSPVPPPPTPTPPPPTPTPPPPAPNPPPPPTNQKPTGSFDGVNTTTKTIFGWAKDADTTSAITVHAYYAKNAGTTGATPVPCTAGDFRSDVGNFAFNCPIPSIYQNGVATQVWVWALDSASLASNNVQLTGSPRTFSIGTVTPTPPPSGSLPGVSNTNGTVNAPPSSGAYAYSSWNPENNSFIALGQSYVDPVFGTTITRMSNQYPNTGSGLIYGKNGFWNANGTRYVHEHTSGNVIIDTTTGAIIRSSVPHSGGDASFDPVDPDAFYYYSGSKLMKLTVSSGATSTLKDFGSTLGAMGGTEDTISADGRYFVLVIAGNARVWDKQTDTLYSGQADGNFGGGWIGMAPDGSGFVVITGGAKKWHEINHATKSIDATGYVFSTEPGDHSTLMSASDGQTYYIKPEDDNTFAIYAHNVRTGAKKKLLQKSTSPGWCDDTHFSNIPRGPLKDWAVVDTEISAAGGTCGSADNTSANNWWKYRQSIILMNVLTGEIREIAHHRSRGNNVYCTGPRINANWDGTAMMFASNFGLTGIGGSCGYSDIYKVTWSGGVPTSPPPPPPPVANSSPVATINLPTSGTTFAAGDVINFSGSATDVQDGNLAASRLSWTIVFHHDTHTHPFEGPINGVSSGSFTIPRTGEPSDNIWYRISLTATDSNGATHTVTRDITPRKVQLTLATNPTGLQITLNGQPQTTPYTFTSVVGYNHVIGATSLQTLSGNTYAFANWGDGGAASKTITAPQTQTTYTANFTQTGTTNTVRDGYVDSFNSTKVAGWGYDNNQSTQVRIVYENVSNTSLTYTQTVAQTISRTDAASWLMTQYGSQLSVNQPLGFEADPRSVITQSGTYRIRSVTMVSSNTAVQISPAATAQVSITVGTTPPPPPPASGGTFTASVVASGLSNATAMEFAPDGRLFVAEKSGRLRVIKNGQLLSTPFVTLSVRDNGEAGLLGVAFDPNFASNNYVYVYYTTSANSHNRVSRFTANGDVAVGASEVALLDLPGLSNAYHHGGAIHFGTDGKLYIAVGDHENSSLAQSLSSPFGKMLRINSDGSIPTDNPYYNSATGINRAIWAFGFRNPFTFAVDGTTGKIYVNDVGQNTYEEINELVRGGNYGWPTCEGAQGSGVGNCNNTSFTYPVFVYSHSVGSAVTGGVFYRGSAYPSDYAGSYFFGDYTGGWIRRMTQSGQVSVWRSASGPIDLKVGTDGNLYMLSIYDGNITKYTYSQ